MSSVYETISFSKLFYISVVNNINRSGLMTLPCGIPDTSDLNVLNLSSTVKLWFRLVKIL